MSRSNGFKLNKFRFNKVIGKNWFTNRVVDKWNRLGNRVVSGNTSQKKKINPWIVMLGGVRFTEAALYRSTGLLQTPYVIIYQF